MRDPCRLVQLCPCQHNRLQPKSLHPMKNRISLALLALLLSSPVLTLAQTKAGKIQAAYLCAFGRGADGGEINYWTGQPDQSVSQYVNLHRNFIRQSAGEREAVIRRSYQDAFGRPANDGEVKHWSQYNQTYAEMLNNHLNYIRDNGGVKDEVIRASYRQSFGREPQTGELTFWRQHTHTYNQLVAMHETWKQTNPSGANTGSANTSERNVKEGNLGSMMAAPVSRELVSQIQSVAGGSALINLNGARAVPTNGGGLIQNGGAYLIVKASPVLLDGLRGGK
jgi:hypothetical protein